MEVQKDAVEIAELVVEELEERTSPGIIIAVQPETEGEIVEHIVEIEELMVEELEERTSPGIIIAV